MAKRKRERTGLLNDTISEHDDRVGRKLLDAGARKARRVSACASSSPRNVSDSNSDVDSDLDVDDYAITYWRELSHVRPGTLAFPRPAYDGYEPPFPAVSESDALREFKAILDRRRETSDAEPLEHDFVVLESFSAYRHPRDARRPGELAGLEKLEVDRGATEGLVFDGILSLDGAKRYVQGVPFKILTIDGYGDASVTNLKDRICIQSPAAKRADIWYLLGKPSPEYARFYDPFLWLAEFTKHFVDYLLDMDNVTLDNFRFCFHGWLVDRCGNDDYFQRWLTVCNLQDFRTTVAAHVPYLWKECSGVETDETALLDHPIWKEVHPYNLEAVPEQPNKEHRTVVTPLVYDMFKDMYFGNQFAPRKVQDKEILQRISRKKSELGLTPFGAGKPAPTGLLTPKTARSSPLTITSDSIDKGDVVCLDADVEGAWKISSSTWYAYVLDVHVSENATMLALLWLYEPHDTTIGAATYPFENELFLSDNCSCGKESIDMRQVKAKVNVTWFTKDPSMETGLFVRQKFRTAHDEGTDDFVTLQTSDFKCRCDNRLSDFDECRMKYDIGDTVLVKTYRGPQQGIMLDPAIIVDFDLNAEQVALLHLPHRGGMGNELLVSDQVMSKPAQQIIRPCHVQILDSDVVDGGLPTGYDRRGAGDFYYIVDAPAVRRRLAKQSMSVMTEGLDLVSPPPFCKLMGMGIFCGGGNFDRGLEDGGAVDFRYAVDWAEKAIYTYRANSREPEKTHCFLGSVNDYLSQAMSGSKSPLIAAPGDIGLLSAGSPCPGFSNLQHDKKSDDSLRNASMVASVVSYVDVFCPKYCILENVVTMTAGMGKDKKQNVFSQIIASFVAMGYQVQQFLADAWSHGSAQSRSRVFIVASAPGLEPLPCPQITHDHPTSDIRICALGKSSNGRGFGVRRNEYTPFPCTTAAEATSDLPNIGDGQARICPSFPDHCLPSEEDAEARERIAVVPRRPYGLGLADAVHKYGVTGRPQEWLMNSSSMKRGLGSKSYSRVRPNGLFPAVTTAQKLACGFTGRSLHWDEDRPLTVVELRRAMGFLDHEPIIGSPRQQVHIIGNSVDRNVSFALGLCLRESWAKSNASRLAGQGETTLVSPRATEEEGNSGDGGEQAMTPLPSTPSPLTDMLRAGASAVTALATPERRALQAIAGDEPRDLRVKNVDSSHGFPDQAG